MESMKSSKTVSYVNKLIDSAITEYYTRIRLLSQAIADDDTDESLKALYRIEAAAHQTHIANLTVLRTAILTYSAGEIYDTHI